MNMLPLFHGKLGSSPSQTARAFTEMDRLWFYRSVACQAVCDGAGLRLVEVAAAVGQAHYLIAVNGHFFPDLSRDRPGCRSDAGLGRIQFAAYSHVDRGDWL